jgi:pyruvate formate lyase activating enzyme
MTVDEVMREIEYDRLFYDQSGGGVTFSGGEPLTQPEFLVALLIACQKRELHTALDTSGYAAKRLIERITPLVDLFLYDLKLLDEELHLRYTGVSNQLILSNLRWLSVKGVNLKVRIPLIPGVNDEEVSLRQMGEFLVELPNPPEIEIMPYHAIGEAKYEGLGKAYRLPGLLSQTPEKIAHTVFIFQSYGLQVHNSAISQP